MIQVAQIFEEEKQAAITLSAKDFEQKNVLVFLINVKRTKTQYCFRPFT